MKRLLIAVMLTTMLLIPGNNSSTLLASAQEVTVTADGTKVQFPDQAPYIVDPGRVMVPVRAPMEALGCTVDWNADKQQATITKGRTTAVFTIGSTNYTINGEVKTMDVEPEITGNRTAFPVRYAAEAMGATVEWDAATYTVLITTIKPKPVIGSKYEKLTAAQIADFKSRPINPAPAEAMENPYVYTTPTGGPTYEYMLDKLVIKSNQSLYSDKSLTFKDHMGLYNFYAVLVTYNDDGSIYKIQEITVFGGYSSNGWGNIGMQDIKTGEIIK